MLPSEEIIKRSEMKTRLQEMEKMLAKSWDIAVKNAKLQNPLSHGYSLREQRIAEIQAYASVVSALEDLDR